MEADEDRIVHGTLPGFGVNQHEDGTANSPIKARFLQVWEPMRLRDEAGNVYELEPGDYRIPDALLATTGAVQSRMAL